ncbi:MAG: putative alpha/beta-fold hydrolase [Myxococcota bacterium]|jgi:predicted alpha/beta-fold hydrolase
MAGSTSGPATGGSTALGEPADHTAADHTEIGRPLWLRNPHAQTIAGRFLRRGGGVHFRRERIDTPDGDFLDLDFVDAPDASWSALGPHAPIALVLHGLEGSARAGYAVQTYLGLARRGIRPVGLNFRTCGGEMNRTPRAYHSGETTDIAFVLAELRRRHPTVPIGAVGFSLGGNVLLKYLGETGPNCLVAAATAVSVPYDLAACVRHIEHGFGRLYTRHFLGRLREKLRAKADLVRGHCDYEAAQRARTLYAYDDAVTAPLHGFRDAEDYYTRSSSSRFLTRVQVPTLLIQARDDPFMAPGTIERLSIADHRWLETAFVPRGGHVGFVKGRWPWSLTFWAEDHAAAFIATTLR